MPRKGPRRPPSRGTGLSAHFCAWPRCGELIALAMLMDSAHWRKVPPHLRDALTAAQRQGSEPAIARATAAIVGYARQQSVAEQGADAR